MSDGTVEWHGELGASLLMLTEKLSQIYALFAAGEKKQALDQLLALISDPQDAGDFAACDAALATLDVSKLGPSGWICVSA